MVGGKRIIAERNHGNEGGRDGLAIIAGGQKRGNLGIAIMGGSVGWM